MAHKSGGNSVGRIIMKIFWTLLCLGLLYALLRAFNWDPFVLLEWAWNWIVAIVTRIADFFTGNEAFQRVTKAPSVINFF